MKRPGISVPQKPGKFSKPKMPPIMPIPIPVPHMAPAEPANQEPATHHVIVVIPHAGTSKGFRSTKAKKGLGL